MVNHLKYPFFILLLSFCIYIFLAGRLIWKFPTEPANYFSHLSYSFLNGRLDLLNPSWDHDLSQFKGKLYMYWGPTPILFILPLVAFFGVNISDVLYTAIFAAFSPFLIYLILVQLDQLKFIHTTNFEKFLLSIFFAFGTVYFSVAVRGGVWFTSQVFSTLYILISFFFLFFYLNCNKIRFLLLSSLFLGLAIWGRSTFIFYLPIFTAFIFHFKPKKIIIFGSILAITFILSFFYNYLRFNSFFENGYSYHNFAPRFLEEKEKYGLINPIYFSHNLYFNFLNLPTFENKFPYIKFNPEGNSFLFLSPLFLLVFYLVRKKFWQTAELKFLNSSIIISISLIIFFQLLFWGTGWFQFSSRYLLDIIPLLIILLAEVISVISNSVTIPLIIISILFNSLGALWLIGVFNA